MGEKTMNDQKFEIDSVNDFFDDNEFEKYEVSEVIQQRTNSAKNFALVSMIVSGILFLLLIGSYGFSLLFPSIGIWAIFTIPFYVACTILEGILMIGAIILNIIALINSSKQQKEFKLYNDGPEKDALKATINLGKIFTYVGAGVAALALILIVPLNFLEFVLSLL